MSKLMGTVTKITGEYLVKSADGTIKILAVGSNVFEDDIIVGNSGIELELALSNGDVLELAGNQIARLGECVGCEDIVDATRTQIDTDDFFAGLDKNLFYLENYDETPTASVSLDTYSLGSTVDRTGEETDVWAQIAPHEASITPNELSGIITASEDVMVDVTAEAGTVTIYTIAGDDIINATESGTQTITISGTAIGGDISEGDSVTVVVNGTNYTTTVQADGAFLVEVATSDLVADNSVSVSVASADNAGNSVTSEASRDITVDLIAEAGTVVINPITADDIINSTESGSSVNVTGTAIGGDIKSGDVVTTSINGTVYTTTVKSDGTFTFANVAGADLVADTDFTVSIVSFDAAGNTVTSTGDSTHTVDTTTTLTADLADASDSAGAGTTGTTTDNLTNDNTPTIEGRGEAGSAITVVIGGQTLTTTVAENGTWSVTTAALADGSYTAEITAVDKAGNTATTAQALTVDTTTNITADLADSSDSAGAGTTGTTTDNLTNDNTPTIEGRGEAGSAITVVIGGQTLTTTVAENGTWSVTTAALADGNYTAAITAVDKAGNSATTAQAVTVDTNIVALNDTNASDAIKEDTDLTVTGNVRANDDQDGTVVAAQTITGTYGTVVLSADGAYTYTLNNGADNIQSLKEGQQVVDTFKYTVTDAAGNTTTANLTLAITGTNDGSVAVDDADIAGLEDTSITISPSKLLSNDTDIDGDILSISSVQDATHGTVSLVNGNVVFTPEANYNGTATFTYTINDGQGGTDTATVTLNITPDGYTLAPTADIIAASDTGSSSSDNITKDNTPTITGTTENGATVTIKDANGNIVGIGTADSGGNYSITTSPLADGTQKLTITATDVAGNTATTEQMITVDTLTAITADLDAASDSGKSNSDNITNDTTPTINGVGEAGSTITIKDGNTVVGSGVVASDGTYSITTTVLGNGTHNLTVTATDTAGNSATATQAVTVDTTAVTNVDLVAASDSGISSTDNLTNDTTPTFTGTASADTATVEIFVDGISKGLADVSSGQWSFTSASLADGNHSITATITDTAGNTNTQNLLFKTDTTTNAVNDTNVIGEDGTTVTGNLFTNDGTQGSFTNDVHTLNTLTTGVGQYGNLSVNQNGSYTYTVDTAKTQFLGIGESATDTFTYTAKDDAGNITNSATLTVTVTGSNDAPIAKADTITSTSPFYEDNSITIQVSQLLANDTDKDSHDVLSISSVQSAANGSVVLNNDGTITFTPTANYSGAANFTYTVSDGHGGTSTAKASFTIAPVTDGVSAAISHITVSTNEDTTIDVTTTIKNNVTFNDFDGSETHTLTLGNLGNGVVLVGGVAQTPVSGFVVINIPSSGGAANYPTISIKPLANSDVDLNGITVKASAQDGAGNVVNETDFTIDLKIDAAADAASISVGTSGAISTTEDTAVNMNITTALKDTDGSEVIEYVKIEDIPVGAKILDANSVVLFTSATGATTYQIDGVGANMTLSELKALKILPTENSSTDFTLKVTTGVLENGTNGGNVATLRATSSANLNITVTPDAADSTITNENVSGVEDRYFSLNLGTVMGDGSESISNYKITSLPVGSHIKYGSVDVVITSSAQSVSIPTVSIDSVKFKPPYNFSGSLTFKLNATVNDKEDSENSVSKSISKDLSVSVIADADAPRLVVKTALGDEDTKIELDIKSSLVDVDGSETLSITIDGIPEGAKLFNGNTELSVVGGKCVVGSSELNNLYIQPPLNSDTDFNLNISATSTESSNSDTATITRILEVVVNATADAIEASASASGNEDSWITLDLEANLNDTDGSEHLYGVIEGIPTSAQIRLLDNDGNIVGDMSGMSLSKLSDSKTDWKLDETLMQNISDGSYKLQILPSQNFSGEIALNFKAISLENSGDTEVVNIPFNVNVSGVVESYDTTRTLYSTEDTWTNLNLPMGGAEISENVQEGSVKLTIPDGISYSFDNGATSYTSNGSEITLSNAQADAIMIKAPENSNVDFGGVVFKRVIVDSETANLDNNAEVATKEIVTNINVDMKGVADGVSGFSANDTNATMNTTTQTATATTTASAWSGVASMAADIGTTTTITADINSQPYQLDGTDNAVKFTGNINVSTLSAYDGNDILDFSKNPKYIDSGAGNDIVRLAGDANDAIALGTGDDALQIANTSKAITAGDGNDTIKIGSHTNDTVDLGAGNDKLDIGGTAKAIYAGTGDDMIRIGSHANANVDLGDDNDYLSIGGTANGIDGGLGSDTVIVASHSNATISMGAGDDSLQIGGDARTVNLNDGNDFLNIIGTTNGTINAGIGDDIVWVKNANNSIDMADGNDILVVREMNSFNSTVYGGAGTDSIWLQGYTQSNWNSNYNNIQSKVNGFENIKFSDGHIISKDSTGNWAQNDGSTVFDNIRTDVFGSVTTTTTTTIETSGSTALSSVITQGTMNDNDGSESRYYIIENDSAVTNNTSWAVQGGISIGNGIWLVKEADFDTAKINITSLDGDGSLNLQTRAVTIENDGDYKVGDIDTFAISYNSNGTPIADGTGSGTSAIADYSDLSLQVGVGSVSENGNGFALNISGAQDGHSYAVVFDASSVTNGTMTSSNAYRLSDGKYVTTDISSIKIVPNDDYSGDISIQNLTILDTDNSSGGVANVSPSPWSITIDSNVDDSTIDGISSTETDEGEVINLNLNIHSSDTDGSEKVVGNIDITPSNGWTLRYSDGSEISQNEGVYSVDSAKLSSLQALPPANVHGEVTFKASYVWSDGSEQKTVTNQEFKVSLASQVDDINISLTPQDAHSAENQKVSLGLNVVQEDSDGSEIASVVIGGVPLGATLVDANGALCGAIREVNTDGTTTWVLTKTQAQNAYIQPDEGWSGDIELSIKAYSYDLASGGISQSDVKSFSVVVDPVASEATVSALDATAIETGTNDGVVVSTPIYVGLVDTDGSESISVVLKNVPEGGAFNIGHTGSEAGTWVIDTAGLKPTDLLKLKFTAPAHTSGDFAIDIEVKTIDSNGDTSSQAYTDTLEVKITATADEATLITNQNTADSTRGDAGVAIPLKISAALVDTDGSETMKVIVDTGGKGTLSAGVNNGDGTWTLTSPQLSGLTITPNATVNFDVKVKVITTESSNGSQAVTAEQTISILSGANNETLDGTSNSDTINGYSGNDTINGGSGNDTINGGSGDDTAVFGDNRSDYTISYDKTAQTFTIIGSDGTDTVKNVENFSFKDGIYAVTDDGLTSAPTYSLATESDSGTVGDNITNDTTPTITGSAEAGAKVEITEVVNGQVVVVGSGFADKDGKYSITTSELVGSEDGINHTLTVIATDMAGNKSTAISTITIDNRASSFTNGSILTVQDNDHTTTYGQGDSSDIATGNFYTGLITVTKNGVTTTYENGSHLEGSDNIVGIRWSQQFETNYTAGNSVEGANIFDATGTFSHITDQGTITVKQNGDWTFTPGDFEYSQSDWQYGFDQFHVDVKMADTAGNTTDWISQKIFINHEADTVADTNSIAEDTLSVTGNVLANDVDANNSTGKYGQLANDGQLLSVANAGEYAGQYGTLTLNSDGSYSYQLDNTKSAVQELSPSDALSETFGYTVSDGAGGVATSTLTIRITGTNDAVTVIADTDTATNAINENVADGTYTGVTLSATDADGDVIIYSLPDNVPFSINEQGQVVTNGDIDFETTPNYTFDATAASVDGTTSTTSITINVNDVVESTVPSTVESIQMGGLEVMIADAQANEETPTLDEQEIPLSSIFTLDSETATTVFAEETTSLALIEVEVTQIDTATTVEQESTELYVDNSAQDVMVQIEADPNAGMA